MVCNYDEGLWRLIHIRGLLPAYPMQNRINRPGRVIRGGGFGDFDGCVYGDGPGDVGGVAHFPEGNERLVCPAN